MSRTPATRRPLVEGEVALSDQAYTIAAHKVPALPFKQWLAEWDSYTSVTNAPSGKPSPFMHLFSMKAGDLRFLSDVYRRKRDDGVAEGIQRFKDRSRTAQIQRYVRFGYPYGGLAQGLRNKDNSHLRKPGWLPTAIVINILKPGDRRRGRALSQQNAVGIVKDDGMFYLQIPSINSYGEGDLPPFEVIDGQHRLWAFDPENLDEAIPDDFELPVVAYHGLDLTWQAYLFWSINVSPKRINRSHAFDLYPLLRSQDWLDQVGELTVYREARAQELVELLYGLDDSPWYRRINMLGEKGGGGVSQNTWVRALTGTLLATGKGTSRPGLFQTEIAEDEGPLGWSRGQQGAFIIALWSDVRTAVTEGHRHFWITQYGPPKSSRPFDDKTSLLNQEMGIRAVLNVANDIFFEEAKAWQLEGWEVPAAEDADIKEEAKTALHLLDRASFRQRVTQLAEGLAEFDWRSLDGPGVKGDEHQEVLKRSYRGSGGYTALRADVLKVLAAQGNDVAEAAQRVLKALSK